jgi:hypothetical protein
MQNILMRRSKARDRRNAEAQAEIAAWLDDVVARTEPEPIIARPRREQPKSTTARVG